MKTKRKGLGFGRFVPRAGCGCFLHGLSPWGECRHHSSAALVFSDRKLVASVMRLWGYTGSGTLELREDSELLHAQISKAATLDVPWFKT